MAVEIEQEEIMTMGYRRGQTGGRKILKRFGFLGFEYVHDIIGVDYMERWQFRTPLLSVRLHRFFRGDTDQYFHDHPMDFIGLILKGGYVEHRPGMPARIFLPGSIVAHKARDFHRVTLLKGESWSILLTSRFYREWGFMTPDGWVHASDFDAWKETKRSFRAYS